MKSLNEYILKDSFFFGILFILLSILLLIIRIYFKESSKMKNHSVASWQAYVNFWAIIAMMFIMGITLLLR